MLSQEHGPKLLEPKTAIAERRVEANRDALGAKLAQAGFGACATSSTRIA
jgi:hypothetical protein